MNGTKHPHPRPPQRGSSILKASMRHTFNGTRLRKWIHNGRRVGRPRMNWAEETVKELWDDIKKKMPGLIKYMAFDDSNELIMDIIKEHAKRNTKGTPINNIP